MGQMPGEDAPTVVWVTHHGRILAELACMAIEACQPVAAANFPVVVGVRLEMGNAGEQSLGPGAIARCFLQRRADWNKILGAR